MKPAIVDAASSIDARTLSELDLLSGDGANRPRAAKACRQAIALVPSATLYWLRIGLLSLGGGLRAASFERVRAVVLAASEPTAPAVATLGLWRQAIGDAAAATSWYRRALALSPAEADVAANLGAALLGLGRWSEAETAARAALAANGNLPQAWNNLGLALQEQHRVAEAQRAFVLAFSLSPGDGNVALNLALIERRLDRPSRAVMTALAGLTGSPADVDLLNVLGSALVTIGEVDAGLDWLGRAQWVQPGHVGSGRSRFGALAYTDRVDAGGRRRIYTDWWSHQPKAVQRSTMRRADSDRLTVGCVSACFMDHPVGRSTKAWLSNRPTGGVRVVCYADVASPDAITRDIERSADLWRSTRHLSDAALARLLSEDQVDILVHLAWHDQGGRPGLAPLADAPVQVSLWDISTYGIETVDYWVTDERLHPSGRHGEEWFAEDFLRAPCQFLFPPPKSAPAVGAIGDERRLLLGSYSNPSKLSETTISAWARILHRVPQADLRLVYRNLYQDPMIAQRVRRAFAGKGIGGDRIILAAGQPSEADHLRSVTELDLALDPFPFNGNTSTFEAIWMGVPVVTLAATRFIGQMGAAILGRLGFDDLIAADVDAYVETAVVLANSPARREKLRDELRSSLARSAFCDGAAFARSMEDLFRQLDMRRPASDERR